MLARTCKNVVDDDIIRSLETAAREKDERTESVEAGKVDAPNRFDCGRDRQMLDSRRGDCHVGKLADDVRDLRRYWRASDPGKEAGVRWPHNQIRANTAGLFARSLKLANHDANDREDHGHLDRDGKNAD